MFVSAITSVGSIYHRPVPRIGTVAGVSRLARVDAVDALKEGLGGATKASQAVPGENEKRKAPAVGGATSRSPPATDPRSAAWLLDRIEDGKAVRGGPAGMPPEADENEENGVRERRADPFGEWASIIGKRAAEEENLSAENQRLLGELRSRDAAVRAHEAAHVAVGGRYVSGGASFSYQRGPDGREYAIGGEVSIDSSVPADPEEALRKMRTVRAAALAPADPSAADRSIAAAAAAAEAAAVAEIAAGRSRGAEAGIAERTEAE